MISSRRQRKGNRMADCCRAQEEGVTLGGIPYTVHEDTCSALYEVPVVALDAAESSDGYCEHGEIHLACRCRGA